ncbi:MAG: DinB family protein [Dehalococcoidia bacterium]
MNREALNELYDYTTFTWETYARAVKPLAPEELRRPLENSGWSSLLEPLVHLAGAWDSWLSQHAGEASFEFDIDAIKTWNEVQAMRAQTRAWMRRILDGNDTDLFEKAETPWPDRPDGTRTTAAELILHMLLHERGHHGDISTLLSQAGITLGSNDYIVYLFFKKLRKP